MIKKATKNDINNIYALIHSKELERSVFIKNPISLIEKIVSKNQSYVAYVNGECVGVVLIESSYLDTIVSNKKGYGNKLLRKLPLKYHKTNVSALNKKSIDMFEREGWKLTGKTILEGEHRLVYEINI